MIPLYFIFGPMILAVMMMLFMSNKSSAAKYIALVLFVLMLFVSIDLLTALPEKGYLTAGPLSCS